MYKRVHDRLETTMLANKASEEHGTHGKKRKEKLTNWPIFPFVATLLLTISSIFFWALAFFLSFLGTFISYFVTWPTCFDVILVKCVYLLYEYLNWREKLRALNNFWKYYYYYCHYLSKKRRRFGRTGVFYKNADFESGIPAEVSSKRNCFQCS